MFGSSLTTSLASAGVFVATIAIGTHASSYALARAFKSPPVALFAPLSLSLGLLVVTPVLLACAVTGFYAPPVLGLIGWIVTAVIRFRIPRGFAAAFTRPVTLILLVVAAAAFFISIRYSGEHIYGGRDQGFYTNLAVWMAHHGKTTVDLPLGLTDPRLAHAIGRGVSASGLYPGIGQFISQFSHAYPAWLAQAYAAAGFQGMDAFDGLLAGCSVLLFFTFARSFMRPVPALLATAFLAFSPAQIWISRITLSELLAQNGVLTMGVLGAWAVRRMCPRLLLSAGIAAAFVFLTRIGGMLLLPPLLVGTAAALLIDSRDLPCARASFWKFSALMVGTFALVSAYYWIDSQPYFDADKSAFLLVGPLTLACCSAGLLLRNDRAGAIRPMLHNQALRVGVMVVLAGLFCWAYFVRPRFDLTFDGLGTLPAAEVMRPFRANTLWNLGQYLSPIVLFAGFAGFSLFVVSKRNTRRFASALPFVAVWLGCALFLLQDPHISADHPWTIRRFVPVVLPGFIFFAFLLVDRLEALVRRKALVLPARTVIVVLMATFVYRATPPTLLHREFEGSREFLADLAAHVPSDRPVFVHGSLLWALPLRMVFDKPVFRLDLNKKAGRRQATEIAERFSDLRCAVVHDRSFPDVANPGDSTEFTWNFDQIKPSPYPLAQEWGHGTINITVGLLDDATSLIGVKSPKFGGQKVQGVAESGFWGQEYEGSVPFRWTKGKASIDLPVEPGTSPRSLRIHYKGISPKGSDIVVKVNGKQLLSKHVADQWGTLDVEGLEQAGITDHIDVSIQSTPFRPVDLGMGNDDRELGIRITYIEIDDDQD